MDEADFQPNAFARLMTATWPAFRAFRVTVRVSWTAIFWPALLAYTFAKWLPVGEALGWGVAMTLGMFASTWLHEMGHIAAGRRCGIDTDRITLRALGGLAHLKAPAQTPRDEIFISLAGPATHLLVLLPLYPLVRMLAPAHRFETWFAMLDGFKQFQISLLCFNLLPVYPLDGGSATRGALSLRMDPSKASYWTANAGFVGNAAFIALGLLSWFELFDPFSFGPYGFLLIWMGYEGILACRRLRFEAQHGSVYGDADPFQKTLLASQAAVRGMDDDERDEREARRASADERRLLQEKADLLLDRINELGGVDKLSARERKELEEASRALAKGE